MDCFENGRSYKARDNEPYQVTVFFLKTDYPPMALIQFYRDKMIDRITG